MCIDIYTTNPCWRTNQHDAAVAQTWGILLIMPGVKVERADQQQNYGTWATHPQRRHQETCTQYKYTICLYKLLRTVCFFPLTSYCVAQTYTTVFQVASHRKCRKSNQSSFQCFLIDQQWKENVIIIVTIWSDVEPYFKVKQHVW